ncbi:MAG: FCD domain-containing protein [Clostridia bacterium]
MLRESIGVLCRTIESNPGRVAEAMSEHEDILVAIASGDAEEAERLGRLHIVSSKNAVLARLRGERRTGAGGPDLLAWPRSAPGVAGLASAHVRRRVPERV